MRFTKGEPSIGESRNDGDYRYYSYRFIGIKPTAYSPFEVNGAGPTNLLRSLTLSCDMCIVDLFNDAHIVTDDSINNGNRRGFIFAELKSNDGGSDESNNQEELERKMKELDEALAELAERDDEGKYNEEDIEKMEEGEEPGEDEEEIDDLLAELFGDDDEDYLTED